MPVDHDKFCLDLFPRARWAYRRPPIVITRDLKEEVGTIDKFLEWNQLIIPFNWQAALKT
jgi:hypothetical protein